jgi:hypothetical protein
MDMDNQVYPIIAGGGARLPELPEDAWTVIFGFLNPCDVASIRGVSLDLKNVASRDIVWDLRIRSWGGVRPIHSRRGEALNFFATQVYPRRRVSLLNCASIYNRSYCCVVNSVTFSKNGIRINFATRSDRSQGNLQNPFSSKLLILHPQTYEEGMVVQSVAKLPVLAESATRGFTEETYNYRSTTLTDTESVGIPVPVEDERGVIRMDEVGYGFLSYSLNGLFLQDSTLSFKFGEGGYTKAFLVSLSTPFIRANHLGHFTWARKLEASG